MINDDIVATNNNATMRRIGGGIWIAIVVFLFQHRLVASHPRSTAGVSHYEEALNDAQTSPVAHEVRTFDGSFALDESKRRVKTSRKERGNRAMTNDMATITLRPSSG